MIWENFLGLLDKEKWHVQGKKICKYQDYFLHFVYLCLFINAQIRYIYRVTYYIFELCYIIPAWNSYIQITTDDRKYVFFE